MFIDKLDYESLVTPEEAFVLSDYRTIKDVYIVNEIAEACKRTDEEKHYRTFLLAVIWNAGRVQGIREERQKKKLKSCS